MHHRPSLGSSHLLTRRALPAAATVAVVLAGSIGAAGAATSHSKPTLVSVAQGAGSAPLATAPPLGDTPSNTPVDVSIVLRARNLGQLESRVQHGWSGHYLSTSQFAATYGQRPQVIHVIEAYLAHFGITTKAFSDGLDIQANGTAGQFNKALSIRLQNFRVRQSSLSDGGHARFRTVHGTRRDPRMPQNVGDPILAILGLSNYSPFVSQEVRAKHERAGRNAAAGTGIPDGDGLAPQDFENLYHLTPLENHGARGQGKTLGIVTLASFRPSTVFGFWNTVLGLHEPANRLKTINVDGGAGPVSAMSGSDETDLDVEQSGAIASGSNVRVYVAPNTDPGFADAFFNAASDNIADTMSVSWGESETDIVAGILSATEPRAYAQVFDEVFAEMGAQGQSNFSSSGDSGAYDASADVGSTNLSVDNPAASPYTTAAGGTTLPGLQTYGVFDADNNLTGTESVNIPHEMAWGWDYLWPLFKALGEPDEATGATDGDLIGGDGGGYSALEPRPSYQRNVSQFNDRRFLPAIHPAEIVPGLTEPTAFGFNPTPALASGSTNRGRAVPDVSTDGDPQTGYAIFDPVLLKDFGGFVGAGGTSFVAPQLNGATAVIDSAVGRRVGFWNPQVYRFAAARHSPFTALNDTKIYSGKQFLFQSDLNGNSTRLPGEFTNTNLFYTGRSGSTWNPAAGLGTPNLTKLAEDFAH